MLGGKVAFVTGASAGTGAAVGGPVKEPSWG